jgi:uncharacterized protein
LSFDHELALGNLDDGGGGTMPVLRSRISGRAEKDGDAIDVEARLSATVRRSCARCLADFEFAVATEFALRLVRHMPSGTGPRGADDPAEDALFLAPDGIADLDLMAAEQIYLGLPMKPVCRQDCRGLCPTCGANRNVVSECGCAVEVEDSRLAPLRELKERMSRS